MSKKFRVSNFMSRRKALTSLASLSSLMVFPKAVASDSKTSVKTKNTSNGEASPIYNINRRGDSRQFTTYDLESKEKAPPIKPGEKKDLVNYEGAGIITHLWMTISGWFWMYWEPETKTDPTILKKLIVRIYWDGNDYPSIEVPIGDFFGVGQCEYKHYLSKYIGMSSGGFYNNFPMPFSKGVRIEMENRHDEVTSHVFLNANYQKLDNLPEDSGRFHCLYNAGTNPGKEPTRVLKTKGRGKFVGCCLSMQGKPKNNLSFLEAPEHIYIDTEEHSKPTIVGTGLEDYFNGGWYFREGTFDGMYHGVPIKDPLRSMITMYRFHENDAINFEKSMEMSFINPKPEEQLAEFKFSSTAYWYQNKATKLAFNLPEKDDLVNWYRLKDTDHQAIP